MNETCLSTSSATTQMMQSFSFFVLFFLYLLEKETGKNSQNNVPHPKTLPLAPFLFEINPFIFFFLTF
jgi:hypothetical protein